MLLFSFEHAQRSFRPTRTGTDATKKEHRARILSECLSLSAEHTRRFRLRPDRRTCRVEWAVIFWGTEWFDASVLDFLPSPLLHIRRYVSQSDWIGMLLDSGQANVRRRRRRPWNASCDCPRRCGRSDTQHDVGEGKTLQLFATHAIASAVIKLGAAMSDPAAGASVQVQ